ncbi:hypothetical protein H3Z83_02285 [Tenacibaculum sp. S7007]|uniref:Uncharacterized protein n=1 Tax=Tenacibaculum pelagium TaxID=2759527 RepID=A0A839ALJ0_9FLAO|nr:hypothetical protein [Tenacibaculum pelagium]MBA6155357.1 hypothetical protein [Tenacibaculum pelagium]
MSRNKELQKCECCQKNFDIEKMRQDQEDANWFCNECWEATEILDKHF